MLLSVLESLGNNYEQNINILNYCRILTIILREYKLPQQMIIISKVFIHE